MEACRLSELSRHFLQLPIASLDSSTQLKLKLRNIEEIFGYCSKKKQYTKTSGMTKEKYKSLISKRILSFVSMSLHIFYVLFSAVFLKRIYFKQGFSVHMKFMTDTVVFLGKNKQTNKKSPKDNIYFLNFRTCDYLFIVKRLNFTLVSKRIFADL